MSTERSHEEYYVPAQSWLPIFMATALFLTVFGAGSWINDMTAQVGTGTSRAIFIAGALLLAGTMYAWFSKVIRENHAGMYSPQLNRSFVWGMGWFIFSEVMFFAAFFGALYYVRNLAVPWLGGEGEKGISNLLWPNFEATWPLMNTPDSEQFPGPKEIIDPMHLPLLNTILLLSSSVTVHFAHTALKKENRQKLKMWLGLTILLGIAFLFFQVEEYIEAYQQLGLTLEAGIYGSTFFMLTGFHGMHVTLGAIILTVIWLRVMKGHFTPEKHFAFEAAAWYWHFVDVVWVGLYVFVYWM